MSACPRHSSHALGTLLEKYASKRGPHRRSCPPLAGPVLGARQRRAGIRRPHRLYLRISGGTHVLGGLNMVPSHALRGPRCSGDSPSARVRHENASRRARVCLGAARRRGTPSKNLLSAAKFACVLSSLRRSFFVFGGKKTKADLKTVSQLLRGL